MQADVALLNSLFGLTLYLAFRVLLTPLASAVVATSAAVLMAFASERKMQQLDLPVLPWDLWFGSDLSAFADFLGLSRSFYVISAGIAVTVVTLVLLWRLRSQVFRSRGYVLPALLTALACVLWHLWVIVPNTPRYLSGQIHNILWDVGANYTNFGPYYSFLVNIKYVTPAIPTDDMFAAAHGVDLLRDVQLTAASEEAPDVVVVLSESFTALPKEIFGVPFTCLGRAPVSRLITPAWGGFTANVEAELLTGYPAAVFPVGAVPYQMYLKRPLQSGLPRVFRDAGYRTGAIHNYQRTFFSRPVAYEMLGFEFYLGVENLPDAAFRGLYADDRVVFDELLRQLEVPTRKPQFLHAVTMMAHLPYDYPERYPIDPRLPSRLPPELERHRLTLLHYASMVYDHEAMLCDFLKRLKARPRRTVVLFYGDHYPSFGSLDVYRDIHKATRGKLPFDLGANYARPPLVLFDSHQGFVRIPPDVPAYNLGTILLRAAGLEPQGIWAMEHKRENTVIANTLYLATQQSATSLGASAGGATPELDVVRAHAHRTLFGADP